MNILIRIGLFTAFGLMTLACGENPPKDSGFTPVKPDVLSFSEDLVVEPMELNEGISDVTVESDAFVTRMVAKAKDQLFDINANGKRGMKVEEITLDLSACGLTPQEEQEVVAEAIVVLVTQDGSKVEELALSSLVGDGAVFVDTSDLVIEEEADDRVQMTVDIISSSCSAVSAQMTYKLSDEDVLTKETLDKMDDETKKITLLNDKIVGVEELTYTTDVVASSVTSETEAYERRSLFMFGFESGTNSFFKMLLLKPSLGNCGLKPAEQTAAEDGLRFNVIAGSGVARSFIAADILSENTQYEGIDYSAYPKAYVEIDNVPAGCETVTSRVSHWVGAADMSPEVVRTCSLKEDAASDAVTWSPDLRSFVITDSTGALKTDARALCSSVGVFDASKLGANAEIKKADEDGDVTKDTYNLKLGDEVISEISCTGSGKLNFIHDHRKLTCADKLMDVDAIAGITAIDDGEEEPVTEEGEE